MNMVWLDYGVIFVYTMVVIGIGVHFSRDKKTSENYLLGGRNMPFVAIGLACMMSLFSSISIVMVPGEIFNHGLTLFILGGTVGMILPIPFYLMFTRFYFKLGSFTPYEYLEYRYDRTVRAVVAFSAFYTRVIYIGMVLYTSAKIFEAAFGCGRDSRIQRDDGQPDAGRIYPRRCEAVVGCDGAEPLLRGGTAG